MSEIRETYYRIGSSVWREYRHDDERIMAFYLLTCEHRTTEGLFLLPLGYIPTDLGWTPKRTRKAFEAIVDSGLVRYDSDAQVCWIVKALKWQHPVNPNQVTSALRKLVALPETELLDRLYESAVAHAERLAEGMRKQFPEQFGQQLPKQLRELKGEHSSSSSNSSSNSKKEANASSVEQGLDAPRATRPAAGAVQRIFDHWRTTTNRHGAQLLPERVTILKARLKHFSEDDLMRAVDGSQTDDAVDVKTGHRYDDFKNIFRNGDNVETNIGRAEKTNATGDTRSFIQRLNAGGKAA